MNHHIQSGGMTALLAALLTAQWFSSSTEGFLDACGNAVWLPVLVGGSVLAPLLTISSASHCCNALPRKRGC